MVHVHINNLSQWTLSFRQKCSDLPWAKFPQPDSQSLEKCWSEVKYGPSFRFKRHVACLGRLKVHDYLSLMTDAVSCPEH